MKALVARTAIIEPRLFWSSRSSAHRARADRARDETDDDGGRGEETFEVRAMGARMRLRKGVESAFKGDSRS